MTTTAIPPTLAPPDDDPLLAALNDPATAAKLVAYARVLTRRYGGSHLDAEDAVQDARVEALQHRDRFDPARGEPGGWLYGILLNVVRHKARDAGRRPAQLPADAAAWERLAPTAPPPDYDMADCRFAVERHLAKLAATERAIVKMKCLEDRDHADIARQLGLSAVAVRAKFSRAMIELKRHAASETEGRS